MTCYRVLIADPLLSMGMVWPPGVRLVRQLEAGTAGTHYWLLEDEGAPPELEGREVELVLARVDGEPVVRERRPVVTHLAAGEGLACCALGPWEVPRGDRMSRDPQAATCEGARTAEAAEAVST